MSNTFDSPPLSLGEVIRKAREIAGISGRELARLAGVSSGCTWSVERTGRAEGETLRRMATVLGLPSDLVLHGVGDFPDAKTIKAAVEAARGGST